MDILPDASHSKFESIARAIRFGFVAIILGLSYPNLRLALSLNLFEQIFQDMLGGKLLPASTILLLQAKPVFAGLAIAIPVAAVALIFVRRLAFSIYGIGALILAVFVQLFFTWSAAVAPMVEVIKGMQSGL